MGIQLYNVFSLTQIRNYSQSICPSAGLLPKPFIQAFKPTFTSKKADPNVGHRYTIFKKAILASSTVFPSCLLYAAAMLCLEKRIQSPFNWKQAGFQCPALALKTASDHHQDQSFTHSNSHKTVKMKVALPWGKVESDSPQFPLLMSWVKEGQEPKRIDFREEGNMGWNKISVQHPQTCITFSAETCRVNFPSV